MQITLAVVQPNQLSGYLLIESTRALSHLYLGARIATKYFQD